MSKGRINKRYTPELKIKVVETMRTEHLSYHEDARQFDVSCSHHTAVLLIFTVLDIMIIDEA